MNTVKRRSKEKEALLCQYYLTMLQHVKYNTWTPSGDGVGPAVVREAMHECRRTLVSMMNGKRLTIHRYLYCLC